MTATIATQNREEWLNKASLLIDSEILEPLTDLQSNRALRIAIAPMRSKRLGECYPSSRNDDGANEIVITAHCDDSELILAVLVHEKIHALDDCKHQHGPVFRKAALAVGLEGKMTATVAGPKLAATLKEYVELLGPIPHSAMSHVAKDKGRNNNKLVCDDCGFKANLSAKWAMRTGDGFQCPVCLMHNTRTIT